MDITEIQFYTLQGWTTDKIRQQLEYDIRMNMYDKPENINNKKFKITIEELSRIDEPNQL